MSDETAHEAGEVPGGVHVVTPDAFRLCANVQTADGIIPGPSADGSMVRVVFMRVSSLNLGTTTAEFAAREGEPDDVFEFVLDPPSALGTAISLLNAVQTIMTQLPPEVQPQAGQADASEPSAGDPPAG